MRMQHREAERRKKIFSSSPTRTPNSSPTPRSHLFLGCRVRRDLSELKCSIVHHNKTAAFHAHEKKVGETIHSKKPSTSRISSSFSKFEGVHNKIIFVVSFSTKLNNIMAKR